MRRRDIITLLGAMAGAWTCTDTFASKTSSMDRIGRLFKSPPPEPQGVFDATLHALGGREGENLQIEVRIANGDLVSLQRLAADLVALRPDVLIGDGSEDVPIPIRSPRRR
jgi:putative tryptophan/tyrosine transport system substrate-binding protein